jgi:hypothetical protein
VRNTRRQQRWCLDCKCTAALTQLIQADHHLIIQITQTFHVKHNDMTQQRQIGPYQQGLIELLFVLDKQQSF